MSDTAIHLACGLAKRFEGLRLRPYRDPVGKWTIGYGSTRDLAGHPVTEHTAPLSTAQAEALLVREMAYALVDVHRYVTVSLSAPQEAALGDFVFNLGEGALEESTLLKLLNGGQYDAVPAQLRRWVHGRVDGEERVLPGLVKRRRAECEMWHAG